jgi:type VI secretion system secreted protein Hcp
VAIDVYLQIDGIKGESQDAKHRDWIECTSVHWGILQPRSATASTGGGHTAERAELKEISFTKIADLASPILMQNCAIGKTIPKAKFDFMRADSNGEPICYFQIELENILIGGIAPSIEPGTILDEHVSLKFSKVKWRYTQQKIGGGGGGSTVGGWDLAANRIVA